jgi:glycosyltransferase involved in cell wall biosynthesis
LLIRHFSTDDISGGAAIAAYRLHNALREARHDSRMYVRNKRSDDPAVVALQWRQTESVFKRMINRLSSVKGRGLSADYEFSFDHPCDLDLEPVLKPDAKAQSINCLHWVNRLLDVRNIRTIYDHFRTPMVWVIHDLAPVTGGCHYSVGCNGYTAECGACPRLGSNDRKDLSHKTWSRKRELLSGLPICFVAPSSWGERRVRESSLFPDARVARIPLPMNTEVFRPLEKEIARKVLRLPSGERILMFGATYLRDGRKGTDRLLAALHQLREMIGTQKNMDSIKIRVLIVGANGRELLSKIPFEAVYTGTIHDELLMALAYQAADVFICPSLDDSGPMMISESMLCGTPVVAFDTGIAPDIIEHGKNGYLASLGDAQDLARGMLSLLIEPKIEDFARRARRKAEQMHAPAEIARQHVELYQSLMAERA